jgi:hypothetical protein
MEDLGVQLHLQAAIRASGDYLALRRAPLWKAQLPDRLTKKLSHRACRNNSPGKTVHQL